MCHLLQKTLCGGPERGKCECNRCMCTEKSKYQGTTCEDCKVYIIPPVNKIRGDTSISVCLADS